MNTVKYVFVIVAFFAVSNAQSKSDEEQIKQVLSDQVAAWNDADIERYMKGYWNSDSTLFVSGGNVTRGYKEVFARYKRTYDTREKMGRLEFNELAVRKFSPFAAIATGVWKLYRADDEPWGRFTLIVEKKPEGWRITHDHTSSVGK